MASKDIATNKHRRLPFLLTLARHQLSVAASISTRVPKAVHLLSILTRLSLSTSMLNTTGFGICFMQIHYLSLVWQLILSRHQNIGSKTTYGLLLQDLLRCSVLETWTPRAFYYSISQTHQDLQVNRTLLSVSIGFTMSSGVLYISFRILVRCAMKYSGINSPFMTFSIL